MDTVSCFVPDEQQKKMFFVGLNLRKCLQRPYEDSNKFHKKKEYKPGKAILGGKIQHFH